jgi:hypothetical protein
MVKMQTNGLDVMCFTTISICNHLKFDSTIKIKNIWIYNIYIVYPI